MTRLRIEPADFSMGDEPAVRAGPVSEVNLSYPTPVVFGDGNASAAGQDVHGDAAEHLLVPGAGGSEGAAKGGAEAADKPRVRTKRERFLLFLLLLLLCCAIAGGAIGLGVGLGLQRGGGGRSPSVAAVAPPPPPLAPSPPPSAGSVVFFATIGAEAAAGFASPAGASLYLKTVATMLQLPMANVASASSHARDALRSPI